MAAENNESLDFRELRGVFTFADHPVDDQVLQTQILATAPHPVFNPQISSRVSKQVSGIGMDKSGTLKLSYSQNCIGDTQKDPDIFGDETQKDPDDLLEETQRDPDFLVDETQKDPEDLVDETQRDPDILAGGTQHDRNNSPWNDIPTVAHRHTSVGLESQEGRNYFDESRRFGSPDKAQQTPAKSIAPLSGLTSAMKGTIPMGLTQIFNNTQDSPLQPTKTARTIPLRCSTSPQRSSPTMNKPIITPPSVGPHKTPSPPPDDAYYSIARSQEERSNRLGKVRKKQDALREENIDDGELSISFDDEVVNRKPPKAQPARRKNDDEVQKLYESMKASKAAKVEKIEKNAKVRKQKPERLEKSEKAGKADKVLGKNPNPSFEQALQSITRESAKGDNANVERREDGGKEKQQTASQKKAEDRARVIAEKRMRNRNFLPPTADDTTTDDDSQPLPPAIHQPALEPKKKTGRYSGIQSGEPQIEISKSATGRKPPTPFGPQDWDSIHEVPRPRSDRHSSVFMRKRTFTSSTNLPDAALDEQPVAPPPKPRAAKSSIKNMPPFNIPKIPPLLNERSTFSPVLLENIYQGSSSLPMPPGMGPYEELPLTSSPPPILLMGDATTTQVERSPSPDEGPVEVSASPSQLCTPQLHKKVCLNQGSIIPETSPIVAEAMTTPIRRSRSRIQDEILEYNEEATDVDETPVPSPMKHVSPNKKKRTSMHIDQEKHGEDFVPSSLPQEDRVPATDEEGDINMGEIRQRSGRVPHISEPEAESGGSTPSFNPRKKRKTGKPLATTQTTGRKENRKQAKSAKSEPVLQNTGSVKSKKMAPTMESLPTLTLNAAPQNEVETVVNQAVAPDPEATNSNALQRVFALFRDKDMYYHPGTVIPSPNVARSHLKIMFDDGTEVLTDKGHVRRLILRVGDVIKCSLGSMKPKYWVVIGFPDSPSEINTPTPNWESTLVDTDGHRTVFLKEKKRAAKLGTVAAALMVITEDDIGEGTIGDVVEVPVTKLYVVKSLWSQFKERVYNLESPSPDEVNPMNRVSFVQSDTPSSKGRRASPMFTIPKPAFSSVQSGVSVKKPGMQARIDGVFSGMVFALSFGNNDSEKKSITTKILAHGGRILDSGFDEVFKSVGGPQLKYVSATTSMISNVSETEKDVDSVEGDNLCATDFGLQPLAGAETIGFACVIADKFSRRFKFLQALALGIPCLASKWVEDCIKSNMVVEWDLYLLPAGESTYLSGAIRSRILPPFSAATTKFMTIIDQRKRLLEGCNVLMIMGKGKLAERRNQLRWLLCAMGARAVRGVISVDEANGILRGAPGTGGNVGEGTGEGIARVKWDLLCLDSNSGSTRGAGKEKLWLGAPKGLGPRIVDDEWVIQSLILGKLLDEA